MLSVQVVGARLAAPPDPLGVTAQLTLPVGRTNGELLVSVTTTSQIACCPTTRGLGSFAYEQLTDVLLARTTSRGTVAPLLWKPLLPETPWVPW